MSSRYPTRNHLLRGLSDEDLGRLESYLEPVSLDVQTCLVSLEKRIEHAYFIEEGIASVLAGPNSKKGSDVGLIGREGMSGIAVLQGSESSPHECYMQVAGSASKIAVPDLQREFNRSEALRQTLLRFAHFFMIQAGETARANSRFTVKKRLARWLLMAHDRLDGDGIPLTHELLALMVGARRVGITIALRSLEEVCVISAQRGRVIIRERDKLRIIAGDSYGIPESYWVPVEQPAPLGAAS